MKILPTICLILILPLFANAQKFTTWIGAEGALTRNYSSVADFGTNVKAVGLGAEAWGFQIRQDLQEAVFLETGFLRNNVAPGFYYQSLGDIGSYGLGSSVRTLQIPFRLGTRINLYKKKYYLVPVIGYSFGIVLNTNRFYGSEIGTNYTSEDTVNYIGSMKSLTHYYSLIQTGLGIECKLFKTALLSFSVNYYAGFQPIMQTDLIYHSNGYPNSTARVLSNGSYLSYGFALKYPISLFWSKK
ncbi:MAG: hypothetical protein PSX81_11745 [bacterium]|nr:hypothetical protein [bacterium]